jgi:hypothetical protein
MQRFEHNRSLMPYAFFSEISSLSARPAGFGFFQLSKSGVLLVSAASGHERRFRDVHAKSGLPPTPERLRHRSEPTLRADIVAKVPEERPGQGNSAIIESEWPVL